MTYDARPTAEIELAFPITLDGETISKLTMRRPKVKDTSWMRSQKGDDFERGLLMLARLCDIAPEHVAELDETDAIQLQAQYERSGTIIPARATAANANGFVMNGDIVINGVTDPKAVGHDVERRLRKMAAGQRRGLHD